MPTTTDTVEVGEFILKLDYLPKRVDISKLTKWDPSEIINLVTIDGADVSLPALHLKQLVHIPVM